LCLPIETPSFGEVAEAVLQILIDLPWKNVGDERLADELFAFIVAENKLDASSRQFVVIEVDQMPWQLMLDAEKPILLFTHASYFMQSFHGPMRHSIWDVIVERVGLDIRACLSGEVRGADGKPKHYIFVRREELARIGITPPAGARPSLIGPDGE
jgi:hypothetical protein